MTTRIILILAVAIMIGESQSLAYGSPACMTESEARAKFPKGHLLWYGSKHCWDNSAAFGARVHPAMSTYSPRPALAAVPLPPPRPALAAEPVLSPQPKIVSSGIDGGTLTGPQCRYSPCE